MVSKRDLVLQKKKSHRGHLVIIPGLLLLIAIASFAFSGSKTAVTPLPYAAELTPPDYQKVKISQTPVNSSVANGLIQIPLQEVQDNKFVITPYSNGAKALKLTSYIAPSGKVITAVSLCEPCRSESFHIDGNVLVCDACGTRWELETLKGISGGCQDFPPDALESTLLDGKVAISESIVSNWQPRV